MHKPASFVIECFMVPLLSFVGILKATINVDPRLLIRHPTGREYERRTPRSDDTVSRRAGPTPRISVSPRRCPRFPTSNCPFPIYPPLNTRLPISSTGLGLSFQEIAH